MILFRDEGVPSDSTPNNPAEDDRPKEAMDESIHS